MSVKYAVFQVWWFAKFIMCTTEQNCWYEDEEKTFPVALIPRLIHSIQGEADCTKLNYENLPARDIQLYVNTVHSISV